MSAAFTIYSPNHKDTRIEIGKDGNIYFPDNDIEYDLTMTEFGEPRTFAIELFEEWNFDKIEFILEKLGLSKQTMIMLSADFAEHVLHFFEEVFPEDDRPRRSIEGARIYALSIETESERLNSKKAFELAMMADGARSMVAGSGTYSALNAAYAAAQAGFAAGSHVRTEHTVANVASYAAKSTSAPDYYSAGVPSDWGKEYAWQIRRFVDCMEALQAGKPWPPMEITK